MTKPYVETIEEQEGRMSRVKGNDPRGSKRLTLVRGKKIQDMDQELKSIFVVEDSKNQPTGTQALMLAILNSMSSICVTRFVLRELGFYFRVFLIMIK